MKMTYKKNWLEWMVLVTGACLVILILGFLMYEAITSEETPPAISISLGTPELREGHYAVSVEAKNKGTQTAEDVRIEVVSGSGAAQEHAEIQFSYLPGNAVQKGWVTFMKNPGAADTLQAHVLGYSTP